MPVPTTPIKFSDIYGEANSMTTPVSPTGVSTLFKSSYFEGPNGSNSIGFNAWGQYGSSSGADRIYGLSASTTNLFFGAYRGLYYYYDNITYFIPQNINNTAPAPPPNINDVNVTTVLWDSTMTYFYLQSTTISPAGSGVQSSQLASANMPIIYNGYWQVIYNTDPNASPSLKADLSINGTSKYTNLGLSAGATTSTDWNTYGSELVASYASGKYGLAFDIAIHT